MCRTACNPQHATCRIAGGMQHAKYVQNTKAHRQGAFTNSANHTAERALHARGRSAATGPRRRMGETDPWALGVGNGCACSAGWGSGSGALGGVVEGGRDDPYEDRAACIDETAKSTKVKRVDWSMVYGTDLERRINTLASIGNRSRSLQVHWAYRVLSGGRGFNSYRWTLESFLATASPQKL